MYGKLIEGNLQIAPKKLNGDGVVVYNPPSEMYITQGWKPVEYTEQPDDPPAGYYYESGWEEQTNAIIQTWILMPLPDDIDESEAYDIIFGGGGE